jgi:hypothetical protein
MNHSHPRQRRPPPLTPARVEGIGSAPEFSRASMLRRYTRVGTLSTPPAAGAGTPGLGRNAFRESRRVQGSSCERQASGPRIEEIGALVIG